MTLLFQLVEGQFAFELGCYRARVYSATVKVAYFVAKDCHALKFILLLQLIDKVLEFSFTLDSFLEDLSGAD